MTFSHVLHNITTLIHWYNKNNLFLKGWKDANTNYTDLINSECGDNSDIEDVYQCIYNRTFSQQEMITTLIRGAASAECKSKYNLFHVCFKGGKNSNCSLIKERYSLVIEF